MTLLAVCARGGVLTFAVMPKRSITNHILIAAQDAVCVAHAGLLGDIGNK